VGDAISSLSFGIPMLWIEFIVIIRLPRLSAGVLEGRIILEKPGRLAEVFQQVCFPLIGISMAALLVLDETMRWWTIYWKTRVFALPFLVGVELLI
jgi:hypothetical protein